MPPAAEELGADVVFNWDHFFPLTGDLAPLRRWIAWRDAQNS